MDYLGRCNLLRRNPIVNGQKISDANVQMARDLYKRLLQKSQLLRDGAEQARVQRKLDAAEVLCAELGLLAAAAAAAAAAHEDTHRRQLWHWGRIDYKRAVQDGQLDKAELARFKPLATLELGIYEAVASESEIHNTQACLEHADRWGLTNLQRECLQAHVIECKNQHIEHRGNEQEIDPRAVHIEIMRLQAEVRACVVEGHEDTLSADFHTEDTTFTMATTATGDEGEEHADAKA